MSENMIIGCDLIKKLDINVHDQLLLHENNYESEKTKSTCMQIIGDTNETKFNWEEYLYDKSKHLQDSKEQEQLTSILWKYRKMWTDETRKMNIGLKHTIELNPNHLIPKCVTYRRGRDEHDKIQIEVKKLIDKGYIKKS